MRKLKILVVDDIFTNRYLLGEVIRLSQHEVLMAENGEEALEIIQKEEIDLVFMDIEMPVMNGIETTRYIRDQLAPPLCALPVIALTAHNPELFFDDFSDAGFDQLITKPYTGEKIRAIIQSLA